ncbi:three-fingered toxin-33 [Crotalus adamanteus]|uniref:Three-fingered toxin-33 n=1 Tax=Crotalus adamanteus TaxID=8729 RepID=A0AAW1BLR8_CROAD
MKALLLTLLLVVSVFIDTGHTLRCYTCRSKTCNESKQCKKRDNICYIMLASFNSGMKLLRGCSKLCPIQKTPVIMNCCNTDRCNDILQTH